MLRELTLKNANMPTEQHFMNEENLANVEKNTTDIDIFITESVASSKRI